MTNADSVDATGDLPDWLLPLADGLQDAERREQVVSIRPGLGGRKAAVLVLIGAGDDGPEILFVERAATMRTHPGQVALPGGATDPGDVDLVDTALREAVEETGVDRSGIVVLGSLPAAHVAVSGFDVTTVVAWWRTPSPVTAVDPREAESVHIISVAELVDPEHRVQVRHPLGYTGPGFQVHGLLIWGLTAHLIDGVLDLAGWQRPWDQSRHAAIPERHLRDSRNVEGRDHPELGEPNAH
ncbi:MAG: CoA pyrophosphatase [Propionibacteriaceae bacterium]